jgi:hypothetical protein
MLAALKDYTIEQGAVFDEQLQWLDSDGNVVDLTGYTALAQVRKNKADTSVTTTFTVTLGGTNGTIRLQLTSAQTRSLSFERAFWDIELCPTGLDATLFNSTSDDLIRLVEGQIFLSKETTKGTS